VFVPVPKLTAEEDAALHLKEYYRVKKWIDENPATPSAGLISMSRYVWAESAVRKRREKSWCAVF